MKTVLISRFGFPEGEVETLVEGQATLEAIVAKFRDHLIAPAAPGDVVFFYFSGHGQPIPGKNPVSVAPKAIGTPSASST